MKFKSKVEYIRKSHLRVPVPPVIEYVTNDSEPGAYPPKFQTIDVGDVVTKACIALETRDNHIKKLLKIVNYLDNLGLSFDELNEYKRAHMNDYYEYAKWKEIDFDDFLNSDR
jgi:hypothetical protein